MILSGSQLLRLPNTAKVTRDKGGSMRRLGLDIGTNSIGWCLIEDDKRIVDIGVRIFSDGRDPKSGASLAVDRRAARAMRRRRDRYVGRRSAFLKVLADHRLMPADIGE